MTSAARQLVLANMSMVKGIAGAVKRQIGAADYDDLVGYGMIGLVESAERWREDKGVEFQGFAYVRVRGAMLDGVRHMSWFKRGDVERERAGGAAMRMTYDKGPDRTCDPVVRMDDVFVRAAVARLPKKERQVIEGRFLHDETLDEIGVRLGIKKSWACRVLARAEASLRESLAVLAP